MCLERVTQPIAFLRKGIVRFNINFFPMGVVVREGALVSLLKIPVVCNKQAG